MLDPECQEDALRAYCTEIKLAGDRFLVEPVPSARKLERSVVRLASGRLTYSVRVKANDKLDATIIEQYLFHLRGWKILEQRDHLLMLENELELGIYRAIIRLDRAPSRRNRPNYFISGTLRTAIPASLQM